MVRHWLRALGPKGPRKTALAMGGRKSARLGPQRRLERQFLRARRSGLLRRLGCRGRDQRIVCMLRRVGARCVCRLSSGARPRTALWSSASFGQRGADVTGDRLNVAG